MKKKKHKIKLSYSDLENGVVLSWIDKNNPKSEEEKHALRVLHKICDAHVADHPLRNGIGELELNDKERALVVKYGWNESENIEVRARCSEILMKYSRDKREISVKTSDEYLQAYKETENGFYLLRSLTVRHIKNSHTEAYLVEVMSAIKGSKNKRFIDGWIETIAELLKAKYNMEKLTEYIDFVENQRNVLRSQHKYYGERNYINALYKIRAINRNDFDLQMALSLESHADHILENTEPNTHNMSVRDLYKDAYGHIYRVHGDVSEIKSRIGKKVKLENLKNNKIMQMMKPVVRARLSQEYIDYVKQITDKLEINSFEDTIAELIKIEFVTKRLIDASLKESGDIIEGFATVEVVENTKGNTVAVNNPEDARRIEAHKKRRLSIRYIIESFYRVYFNCNIEVDSESLFRYMETNKPKFVDEDKLMMWVMGIEAGLNNDFITAAHILTPQLERAISRIVEIEKGNITKLEQERQEYPTLSAILELSKGIIKDTVLDELRSFLLEPYDANFRNKLAHGLSSSMEVESEGKYLWWLCLKFFFGEDWRGVE